MAWLTVRLENEDGEPISEKDAVVDSRLLDPLADHTLLRYIDEYGDTILNHLQMEDFIQGWKLIAPNSVEQKKKWEKVLGMAEKCRDEVHLYLKFIGD
ncbi:MAG: hypothetical protein ACR2IF_11210 [Terriglobales bacterium]